MAAIESNIAPDGSTSPPSLTKTMEKSKSADNLPKPVKHSKPTHPTTALMFKTAISALNEHKGSSLKAIQKYICANFDVNMKSFPPTLKRYVKNGLANDLIIQTKGTGLTGSFKLPPVKVSKKKPKPVDEAVDTEKVVKPKVRKLKVKALSEPTVNIPSEPKIKAPSEPKPKATKKKADASDASENPPAKKPVEKKKATRAKKTENPPEEIVAAPVEKKKTAPKRGKAVDKLMVDEEKQLKSPKAKKARSPIAKPKTPKPKKLTGKKITKKAAAAAAAAVTEM